MTTSSRKNYNVLALRGQAVDDMEYVEQFGLDPAVAYTPHLNTAMLDLTEQHNTDHYIQQDGLSEAEAKTKARNERTSAEKDIRRLLK